MAWRSQSRLTSRWSKTSSVLKKMRSGLADMISDLDLKLSDLFLIVYRSLSEVTLGVV